MFISTREMLDYERNVNEAAIRDSLGSIAIPGLLDNEGVRSLLNEMGTAAFSDDALRKITAALHNLNAK